MRVLKEDYAPSEEQYSDFAEKLIRDIADSEEDSEIEKTESTGDTNGVAYRQINYSHPGEDSDGLDISIIFISQDNMLYLFIKVSDIYYRTFADNLIENILESLSFN